MKPIVLLIVVMGFSASVGAESQAPVATLPAYSLGPEFTLLGSVGASGVADRTTFVSVDEQARSRSRGLIKFRSATLISGDEIVRLNGRLVTEMTPSECRRILMTSKPNAKIALEVRQPGSMSERVRQAVVVRVLHPEEKIADDSKLREFAELARPACIFDERGAVIFDTGAMQTINGIEVERPAKEAGARMKDNLPRKIVVRTKKRLGQAPLLTMADGYQVAVSIERRSELEWVYTLEFDRETGAAPFIACRFRLAIY